MAINPKCLSGNILNPLNRLWIGVDDAQVRIMFQVDRAPLSFQLPILLSIKDFDDTEMIQAARSALHRTFVELAAQSQKWKLTPQDLRQLSSMSSRPNT